MKTILTAAIAAFALAVPFAAPYAVAGEGNNLAAVEAPMTGTVIVAGPATPDTGSEAEPGFAARALTQSNVAFRDGGAEAYQDFSGPTVLDSAVRTIAGQPRYSINPTG
jgi:hypothetical protein